MPQVMVADAFHSVIAEEAKKNNCSIEEQVEFWLSIGKLAEENPGATYNMIMEALSDDSVTGDKDSE
jgi:hypothetical protein